MSPFAYSRKLDDPAKQEIVRLPHRFSPTESKLDGIDLKEVKGADGRDAYDRLQELVGSTKLGGKTLAESLNALVKSPLYQRLPDAGDGIEPTGRIDAIGRVISAYRAHAKSSLLRESPELLQQVVDRRRAMMAGRIPQAAAAVGLPE